VKRSPRADGHDLEPTVRELRGSLANLRAASEALDLLAPPDESTDAKRLRAVVLAEAARLSGIVDHLGAALLPIERPARGRRALGDLISELAREARTDLDLPIDLEAPPDVPNVRLANGAALVAALLGALGRLRRDFAVGHLALRARLHQGLVALDLLWPASEPELWRLRESHAELLSGGSRGESPLRDVVQAMGGEVWLTVDRAAASAALRLLLPPA
jgi:hypothetical protein